MRIEHNDPPLDVLRQMGYEPRDVAIGTLVRWLVYLWIFILLMSIMALAIYWFFVPPHAEVQRMSAVTGTRQMPPNPVVQAYPKRDMAEFLEAEEAATEQYSWANRERTRVNIPIEEAMERMAARGISGVTDTGAASEGQGTGVATGNYPGSGNFATSRLLPTQDQAPNDVTDYNSSSNGLLEGSPRPSRIRSGSSSSSGGGGPHSSPPSGGDASLNGGPAGIHGGEAGDGAGTAVPPGPAAAAEAGAGH